MADAKLLDKLTREQLNQLATDKQIGGAENFPNKDAVIEQLVNVTTDEEVNALLGNDPALNDEDDNATDTQGVDPAVEGDDEEVGLTADDVKVDGYVRYPYADAEGGYRQGRVKAVSDTSVDVLWVDGRTRTYSLNVVKKAN